MQSIFYILQQENRKISSKVAIITVMGDEVALGGWGDAELQKAVDIDVINRIECYQEQK